MKTIKYLTLLLIVIQLTFCRTKENDLINAEYKKIEGIWTLNTVSLSPNAPDSLRSFFKSGGFLFSPCTYSANHTDKYGGYCGGDVELNETLLSISNNYSYSEQLFVWELIELGAKTKNIYSKGSQLIDGAWDIQVSNNKMIGKRIRASKNYKGEVMFTATRK